MIYKPPVITILNDREFELVEPLIFEWADPLEWQITIPAGFPFDGASVPRICWTLTGLLPTGVHLGAAAVHDYGYQRRGRLIRGEIKTKENGEWVPVPINWNNRKKWDDLFLLIMKAANETPWKAWAMHKAVRLFGGPAWNN